VLAFVAQVDCDGRHVSLLPSGGWQSPRTFDLMLGLERHTRRIDTGFSRSISSCP